ncbi:DDE_Tnp_1_7 domain-containing protein [Nephila pilipes]|uniref:DDE_Tnp_1_7 domain-containing protein n=1 Tax=Nephila pilipes TaxID=299642 RepID=A0A8X6U8Z1_NEPPI|nr:DDE_Tnp_1_7 domain-containing protein [Nephila pilipes]
MRTLRKRTKVNVTLGSRFLHTYITLEGYGIVEVYSGTKNIECLPGEPDLGSISNTVIRLLRLVPRHVNRVIYYDNFYSNIPLLHYLIIDGIYYLSTVQRILQVAREKEILKSNVPRGVTMKMLPLLKVWNSRQQAGKTISKFYCYPPMLVLNHQRLSRDDKKIENDYPSIIHRVIKKSNAHMGGVDLMERFIGRHGIRIKSRTWTTRLFNHLLDMNVINAWVPYKKVVQ